MTLASVRFERTWRRSLAFGVSLRTVSMLLRQLPRWLFLVALIYAPWDYGAATTGAIRRLDYLLAAMSITWLVAVIANRRRPPISPFVLALGLAVLALGWWMALNARSIYDPHFEIFLPLPIWSAWTPASVDRAISCAWMLRATNLVVAIWFVSDLCRRSEWLLRIWITIGATGGSIALLGLMQKATGAVLPFWEYRPWEFSSFFATFYYHANAGAFLYLVFPLTAGLAIRAYQKKDAPVQRTLWLLATLLVTVAMVVNTSRAAQVISVFIVLAIATGSARRLLRRAAKNNPLAFGVTVGVALLILVAVAQAPSFIKPVERWRQTLSGLSSERRWQAYRTAYEAIPDVKLFGFGPGAFRAAFPHYIDAVKNSPAGTWAYLHEDYLQTLLEWGWLGSAGWAAFFLGGIAVGVRSLARMRKAKLQDRRRLLLPACLIALGGVAIHALVDFPLQIYSIQLYAATCLGICWGSARWDLTPIRKSSELRVVTPA